MRSTTDEFDESWCENDLEREFLRTFNAVHDKIQENLHQASLLIEQACQLADDNGIPFKPKFPLCGFKMSYIPQSYEDKFPKLDRDFMNNLTDAYGGYEGWQTSQVC